MWPTASATSPTTPPSAGLPSAPGSTGPAASAGGTTTPVVRPRRRWPWVVAVVLLLALAAGSGAVAWEQRSVAAEWRDRAEVLETQRDEALGRGEALQRQLDETADLLSTSEADVAELENRIRELADEIAQAQDEATTVQVQRDVFVELSATVTDAVEALDVCVTRLFDLLNDSLEAYNAAAAGEPVDVGPLNAASTATTNFCNDARSAAAGAGAAADELLRQ